MREGLENLRIPFISSISEHKTLVTCSNILCFLVLMDSLRNGWILLLNHNQDRHILGIQTNIVWCVANILADCSNNLFNIDVCSGSYFSKSSYYWSFACCLTSWFSVRILSKTGIQNRVWDLITELVWMSLTHWFRSKEEVSFGELRSFDELWIHSLDDFYL